MPCVTNAFNGELSLTLQQSLDILKHYFLCAGFCTLASQVKSFV